jgi:hypothetical protein
MDEIKFVESLMVTIEIPFEKFCENRWFVKNEKIQDIIEQVFRKYGYDIIIEEDSNIIVYKE